MNKHWKAVALGEVLSHRKEFITIDDSQEYKRCKVQVNVRGIVLRDAVKGLNIKTKKQQVCQAGEFLVAEIDAKMGGFGIVPPELKNAVVSSHYFLFGIDATVIDKRFFEFFIKTPAFCDQVSAQGSTNYSAIRPSQVLSYQIFLPPLTEQRRIVARVETLVAKVDEAKRLRQEIATDIEHLLAAMAHRNDLSEDEKLKQGWLKLKLGDVLSQVKNAQSVKATESYRGLGIYSFGKGCIKKKPISGSEIKATTLYKVSAGQFIYARLNAYEGSFALVTNEFDGCYVSNEFPTFDCNAEYILPEFLMAYFHTPHTWQELRKKITGIGGDSGNRRIRLREKDFLSHQILLPPLSWQHKIKQIHRQQKDIKPLQNTVEKELNALMPAILDKAFKGEL